MPARKVAEILIDAPNLRAIAEATQRTQELQRTYVETVPDELSRASRICSARSGMLSVAAGNGAVAAKLRQLAPRILRRFRQLGHEFNSMRVEVQVGWASDPSPDICAKPLSAKALEAIRATGSELPDSPLKAAMMRLGRRRRP
jgi:hypothetical protein